MQIASREGHSAIAQHVMTGVERTIQANPRLSLASSKEGHDVEFLLVSAPSDGQPGASAAAPFWLFFVLTDRDGKFLPADTLRCPKGPPDGNNAEISDALGKKKLAMILMQPLIG